MNLPVVMDPIEVAMLEGGRKVSKRFMAWATRPGFDRATAMDRYDQTKPSKWCKLQMGDLLWVQEPAWFPEGRTPGSQVHYRSTDPATGILWSPSNHMPRWASRCTFVIASKRIELLHSISDDDCFAEGLETFGRDDGERMFCNPLAPNEAGNRLFAFGSLWKHQYGAPCWDANPPVVVIEFTVHWCNIDAVQKAMKAA